MLSRCRPWLLPGLLGINCHVWNLVRPRQSVAMDFVSKRATGLMPIRRRPGCRREFPDPRTCPLHRSAWRHSSVIRQANLSAARVERKGLSRHKRPPSRHRCAVVGPFHLFHGALARPAVRQRWRCRTVTDECGAESRSSQCRGINSRIRLPRKTGQAVFWIWKAIGGVMQSEIQGGPWAARRLRNVAMSYRTGVFPWPGVPP